MQNYTFFGLEPHQRAPELFGVLTTSPELEWVGIDHIVSALERGEEVHIRPASDAERTRADAAIALFEVGTLIAGKLESLLDQPGMVRPESDVMEAGK